MAIKTKEILKSYFETGDKPTESQFADLIDSLAHESTNVMRYTKDETISEESVGRLAMTRITSSGNEIIFNAYQGLIGVVDVSGTFNIGDTIASSGGGTAILVRIEEVEDVGEDEGYLLFLSTIAGTFTTADTVTTSSGGAGTINTDSVYIRPLEVGDVVVASNDFGQSHIAYLEVIAVDDYEITATITNQLDNFTLDTLLLNTNDPFDIIIISIEEIISQPEAGGEEASIAQTSEAVEDTKAVIRLEVHNALRNEVEPLGRIIRINFNGDNIEDGQELFIYDSTQGSLEFGGNPLVTFSTGSSNFETRIVGIGATLSDTIDELEAFLADENLVSDIWLKVVDRNGSNSIDLEVSHNDVLSNQFDNSGLQGKRRNYILQGDLGNDSSGGYATFSIERELTNPTFANTIVQFGNDLLSPIFNIFWNNGNTNFLYGYLLYQVDNVLTYELSASEFHNRLLDALNNDNGLLTYFDIIDDEQHDGYSNVIIRQKNSPTSSNIWTSYDTNANFGESLGSNVEISPQARIPELVRNTVLGVIVGVDGDDVLIDSSYLCKIKLAGENESISSNYALPHIAPTSSGNDSNQIFPLIAWKNGTVASLYSMLEQTNQGTSWQAVQGVWQRMINTGGLFMPLERTMGKEEVRVSRALPFLFGN